MKYSIFTILIIIGFTTACKESSKSEEGGADKIIYDVVFRDNLAGTYEKWETADNIFEFYYTFTDRGRGPKYNEEISLNEQNFIIEQNIKGVNYLNVSIDEKFSTDKSTATSENLMGTSKGDFQGDKLYFRYDGSPAVYEILAQLLLKSETGKLIFILKGLQNL